MPTVKGEVFLEVLLGDCPLSSYARIQHLPPGTLSHLTPWKGIQADAGWVSQKRALRCRVKCRTFIRCALGISSCGMEARMQNWAERESELPCSP